MIADFVPTRAQRFALTYMCERGGKVHSGRNGLSENTMRALERRGLVRRGRVSVHETHWHLTNAGRVCAETLSREQRGDAEPETDTD